MHLAGTVRVRQKEVDVAHTDGGRLVEPAAGEGAQADRGPEGLVGGLQDGADLSRCRQRHGGGRAATAGEGHALAGVAGDDPVSDGAAGGRRGRCSRGVHGARREPAGEQTLIQCST